MAWRRRQFFNEVLGRDKGKHQALLEAAAAVEEESSSSSSESSSSEEERLRGKRALRWERGADIQGRTYYYDSTTGITQWHTPDDPEELVYLGKQKEFLIRIGILVVGR